MLVDKQNGLMSNLSFTVHQHGGDDVTRKPPICRQLNFSFFEVFNMTWGCTGTNHRRTSLWHLSSFFRCGPRYPRSSTHQPEVILVVSLGERVNKNQKLNERKKNCGNVCPHLGRSKSAQSFQYFKMAGHNFQRSYPDGKNENRGYDFSPGLSFIMHTCFMYSLSRWLFVWSCKGVLHA